MNVQPDDFHQAGSRPTHVVTILKSATVQQAAKLMRDNRVGAVVVTDEDGRLAGIVTERDLVNLILPTSADSAAVLVEEIMTADPASCRLGAPMSEAKEIMMSRRIRHLPVVDDNGVVRDIISARDVMAHQAVSDRAMRSAAEQIAMLSTCLKSLDFDEVVEMVTRQVPQIFQAANCVLFFPPQEDRALPPLLVHHDRCPCADTKLQTRRDAKRAMRCREISVGDVPAHCAKLGCASPSIVVPLSVAGLIGGDGAEPRDAHGYLCMCGLSPAVAETMDLVWYKGALVREILSANLTNARLYQKARRDALTDALTKVGSRRLFEQKLEEESSRARRHKLTFCVAMLDLDSFKLVNDKTGHTSGDDVLCRFAGCVAGEKRASDVLARFGGDEFVLLMPQTDLDGAVKLLERVRALTQELNMPHDRAMTVSCGVAEYRPGSNVTTNKLVRLADLALYEAKRGGRNRVKTWAEVAGRFHGGRRVQSGKVAELQERVAEMSLRSKEVFVQSLWGLVRALEARDRYTRSHSDNVMRYAVGIAETMELAAEDIDVIRRAAMIHDVGKIGVPDHILRKPGKLTVEERKTMQQHPLIAVQILDQMRFLERELPIVRHHHERCDGRGYPDGLSGEAVPLGARVLAVADSFDAMTSDRVYRTARPMADAVGELTKGAGTQFDPDVVRAMLAWIEHVGRNVEGGATPQHLLEAQKACTVAA